ncbi:multidrug resistance protein [Escherichia coli]|uniref:Multidrug resistance protein n=1 Tax=Escherichia coli TaxID=562 RepID=A0A2X1JJB8_ECOLX|nr:multidrug resistance protein [Escherichia coli]
MSALNSLPLPVVRLLAFFHEELSERRPGRVPQTVQLWGRLPAGDSDLDDL